MQMNNERFKFTSILQATRNLIIVISRINNNFQYIIMFIFISLINTSILFNYTLFALFFYVILTFSAFSLSSNSITSIFVNKLTIDSTTQKTRLSNATSVENVEIKIKRAFNHHVKFRSTKNFSMNLLIDLIVLFNYNSIVIKTTLTLFVKTFQFLRIFTNRNYTKKR